MAALAAARQRKVKAGHGPFVYPVKATSQIHQNGLVVLLAGVAIAARTGANAGEAATMKCVGVANHSVLGGAADGLEKVSVDRGELHCFANSAAGDLVVLADVGADCFVVDDQTVAKTSNASVRCKAGRVEDVTSEGVWVRVGFYS